MQPFAALSHTQTAYSQRISGLNGPIRSDTHNLDVQVRSTLYTNKRTVSFGGNGGSGEDMSIPPDLSRRIVAFVGTSKGILEKLGVISVSRNWEEVGPLVLLRTLVEKNRASLVLQDGDANAC